MAENTNTATIDGPAPGGVALLIIDMINDLSFEGGEKLQPRIQNIASTVLTLRDRADRLRVPIVYINDNYGHWHSEPSRIVEACAAAGGAAGALVRRMAPRREDYFVVKPQVSGFYATSLPALLPRLRVSRLVLTGVAADICVLFTAADAHMREYQLWAPRDAVASESDERADWALRIMRDSLAADTRPTTQLSLDDWVDKASPATTRACDLGGDCS